MTRAAAHATALTPRIATTATSGVASPMGETTEVRGQRETLLGWCDAPGHARFRQH
jgi:hypothetical protein